MNLPREIWFRIATLCPEQLWLFKQISRVTNSVTKQLASSDDIFEGILGNYWYSAQSNNHIIEDKIPLATFLDNYHYYHDDALIKYKQFLRRNCLYKYVSRSLGQVMYKNDIQKYDPYNDIFIIFSNFCGCYHTITHEHISFIIKDACRLEDIYYDLKLYKNNILVRPNFYRYTKAEINKLGKELIKYFTSSKYNCMTGNLGQLLRARFTL